RGRACPGHRLGLGAGVGWRGLQPALPRGAGPLSCSLQQGLSHPPLSALTTFTFPLQSQWVLLHRGVCLHQRSSSAQREGPGKRGGGCDPEQTLTRALTSLGPKQEVGGASAERAGRCLDKGLSKAGPLGEEMDLQYLREEAEAWLEYYIQKPWTRNPMEQLYRDYFYFHFYNLPNPRCRLGCYICYQVEGTQTHLPMPLKKGVFENQVWAPLYPHQRQELSPGMMRKTTIRKMPDASSHTLSYILGL
uniref:Uncharacterized protein n=1 Tax=Rhinolophus ferrumequinum TaxID=59479 RepID=A0A671DSA2_RHIFE